ncbi:MAG: GreA/GreB family elongation factor [Thermoanaerobaculales bacterium]|jgi:transcription elongation GreA/GreB family factor|nr:GreA/GreB family elongation factor [Thermoanaerobaculales bacterium]
MADQSTVSPAFLDALSSDDFDRVEELWLEALDRDRIRVDELLEVRHLLWEAGRKNLALTLLDLLSETLEERDDPFQTLAVLKEQVRLADKPGGRLVERLQRALTATRADSPSLEAVVSRYPLTSQRRPTEALAAIESWLDHDRGTVVEVAGQGVGRVIELNLELDNIKVDLGGRRPVSVPFGAVSRYLRPLPEGDFRRRKVEDPSSLAAFVRDDPGGALVELIESLGNDVDVTSIKAGLEGVLDPTGWTSWWGRARKHPRILTSGTGSRLRYSAGESADDATDALLAELEGAEPRHRLAIAKRIAARGREGATAATRILAASIEGLVDDPGLVWETAAALEALPEGSEAATAARSRVLEEARPLALLRGIQDRAARVAALQALRERHQDWTAIWGDWLLHEETPSVLDDIAAALEAAGASEVLDAAVEAVFRNHVQHAAQFVWACERMTDEAAPEAIRRRMSPSLLEKIPDGLTRRDFAPLRGRCKGLLDGGKVAIRLLLESANQGQALRFSQRVARAPGVEPQRVKLVEQAAHQAHGPSETDQGPLLVATQRAIEDRRAELARLLEVEIPKTLKGINAAAAEGDLRENFEYHMLRDRQELQSARAAKLQRELGEVRVLEPGKADTSRVNIGTVVRFAGDAAEPVTILGAWDADVERRIFANGSELAEALLGCRVGDEVEVEGRPVTIASIDAWLG